MRRWIPAAVTLGALGGCNFFGGTTSAPTEFGGWFHLDRPGRATNLGFSDFNVALIRDLGCDQPLNGETEWAQDGDALVLPQWGTPPPRFTQSTDGGLVAVPGVYSSSAEQWLAGATCLICPPGDAGVAVACDAPAVLDGGT